MKREELLRSKEYWMVGIQNALFNSIKTFMDKNEMNQTQLADHLGVTKGYVSQILKGDFDHKLSKLVELSLACGYVPLTSFKDTEAYIREDAVGSGKEI